MQESNATAPDLIELRIIYNFLDQHNTGEIKTVDINKLSRKFEDLRKKNESTALADITNLKVEPEGLEKLRKKPGRQSRSVSKRTSTETTPTRLRPIPSITRVSTQSVLDIQREARAIDTERPTGITHSISHSAIPPSGREFMVFPHRKQTMDFNEFQRLYEEFMQKFESSPELMLQCFSLFDYTQDGFVNAEKLREVMSIFGIASTEEETERLMKFIGCKNSVMTFSQFERIFGE